MFGLTVRNCISHCYNQLVKEVFNQPSEQFTYPDIFAESGELVRVGAEFGIELSVLQYLAQQGTMVSLSSDIWNRLENTDSTKITLGGWDQVAFLSSQIGRDWESLKEKVQNGTPLDAPIVMKFGDRYHLVSGNTRLMVLKAAGVIPQVLLFEIE